MQLPVIEKGKLGWRTRRAENHVLEVLGRATTGQTGWHVWNKIRHKEPRWRAYEIHDLMGNLQRRGLLEICGCADDGDYMYKLPSE